MGRVPLATVARKERAAHAPEGSVLSSSAVLVLFSMLLKVVSLYEGFKGSSLVFSGSA